MLNLKQFKYLVRTVLDAINLGGDTAVNLLTGTALYESDLIYLLQFPVAHAVSLFQIEKATYLGLRERLKRKPDLRNKILAYCSLTDIPEDYNHLVGNIALSIIMARLKYYLIPNPLPANEPLALAQYYKQFYNTPQGKADVNKAVISFQIASAA